MHLSTLVMRGLSQAAVSQLAYVDYSIANKVTEDVSVVVQWAYQHDAPWLASSAVQWLQTFDGIGASLIAFVVWLVSVTP